MCVTIIKFVNQKNGWFSVEKILLPLRENGYSFKDLFSDFIRIKKYSNLSEYTLIYYQRCFDYFAKFFDVGSSCSCITIDTIYDYIAYQSEKLSINEITINTNLRGLKAILYYGMEMGYLSYFKIKLLKTEKEIKEVYTNEELTLLLKRPDVKKCSFAELRSWAITNYLLATGNRLSTLANLKIGDIDFNNNEIILRKTKNRKQYIIPLSEELAIVLKDYLSYRKGTSKEDCLFCSVYGDKLSNRGIQDSIQKYNNKRGVFKTSIHIYRHTFAKHYLLNGGDIFRLKEILGHSSIEIVKEYVNMFLGDLKKDFNTFNPLDNIIRNNRKERIKMIN